MSAKAAWQAADRQFQSLLKNVEQYELASGTKLTAKDPRTKVRHWVVSFGAEAIDSLKNRLKKAVEEGFEPDVVPIVFPNALSGHIRNSNFDRNV